MSMKVKITPIPHNCQYTYVIYHDGYPICVAIVDSVIDSNSLCDEYAEQLGFERKDICCAYMGFNSIKVECE